MNVRPDADSELRFAIFAITDDEVSRLHTFDGWLLRTEVWSVVPGSFNVAIRAKHERDQLRNRTFPVFVPEGALDTVIEERIRAATRHAIEQMFPTA